MSKLEKNIFVLNKHFYFLSIFFFLFCNVYLSLEPEQEPESEIYKMVDAPGVLIILFLIQGVESSDNLQLLTPSAAGYLK
jgi:hypothetical protein